MALAPKRYDGEIIDRNNNIVQVTLITPQVKLGGCLSVITTVIAAVLRNLFFP